MSRRPYRRKASEAVVAVRLALDTDGFTYRKWGGEQRCKAGDWLVDSGEDVYTVDAESFAATYEETARGRYVKTATVWAERAESAGSVDTREGVTRYEAGDYLVSNDADGEDVYALARERFDAMYAPLEGEGAEGAPPSRDGGR